MNKTQAEQIDVFRKILVDEFGIQSEEQFFATEGEEMAVIYENMKAEQENFGLSDEEMEDILGQLFE